MTTLPRQSLAAVTTAPNLLAAVLPGLERKCCMLYHCR